MSESDQVVAPVVMDITQAAQYLATTVRHMRELVYQRRITYTKVGAKLRFRRSDLDAYLNAHTQLAVD